MDPDVNQHRTKEYNAYKDSSLNYNRDRMQESVSQFKRGNMQKRLSGLRKICQYDYSEKGNLSNEQNANHIPSISPIRNNSLLEYPKINKQHL